HGEHECRDTRARDRDSRRGDRAVQAAGVLRDGGTQLGHAKVRVIEGIAGGERAGGGIADARVRDLGRLSKPEREDVGPAHRGVGDLAYARGGQAADRGSRACIDGRFRCGAAVHDRDDRAFYTSPGRPRGRWVSRRNAGRMRQITLDTETTGLEYENGHRIIEIACVEVIGRRLTQRNLHFYLNPEREIDAAATQVHGMTLEDLRDKPRFAEIVDEFL